MELKEVSCEEGMSQQIYCSSPQTFWHQRQILWASLVSQLIKNPPVNTGDARDSGSIPGSGRSPGEGNGNLLQ